MKYKTTIAGGSVLAAVLASLPLVAAQQSGLLSLPDPVKALMQFVFIDLSKYNLEGGTTFFIFAKFLIFILVLCTIYLGVSKIFKPAEGKKPVIPVIISIVLSLMGTILIPNELIGTLFQIYSTTVSLALGLLVPVVGLYINHTFLKGNERWQRFMKGGVYGLMFWVGGTFFNSLATGGEYIFSGWFSLGLTYCLFAGIWNIVWGFAGDREAAGRPISFFGKKGITIPETSAGGPPPGSGAEASDAENIAAEETAEQGYLQHITQQLGTGGTTIRDIGERLDKIVTILSAGYSLQDARVLGALRQQEQQVVVGDQQISTALQQYQEQLTNLENIGKKVNAAALKQYAQALGVEYNAVGVPKRGENAEKYQAIKAVMEDIRNQVQAKQEPFIRQLREGIVALDAFRNGYAMRIQSAFNALTNVTGVQLAVQNLKTAKTLLGQFATTVTALQGIAQQMDQSILKTVQDENEMKSILKSEARL